MPFKSPGIALHTSTVAVSDSGGTDPTGNSAVELFPPSGRLSVDGYDFACAEEGTGDPIVFIHGSLGTLLDFAPAVRHFAGNHRAITYSRRFHPPNAPGRSGAEYTIAGHADDLAGLLRALKIESAHLAGSSWGAYVALFLATRHPALIRTLVLGEPPVLPLLRRSPVGRDLLDIFQRETIQPSLARLRRGDDVAGVRTFVDGVTGRSGTFDALPVEARRLVMLSSRELRMEFETPVATYMPDLPVDSLHALTCPVLLLEGERSPKLFHLITDELELAIPRTERTIIPRAGHSMHAGNPDAYCRAVGRFLSRSEREHHTQVSR